MSDRIIVRVSDLNQTVNVPDRQAVVTSQTGPPGPPGSYGPPGPPVIAFPKRTNLYKVVGEIAAAGGTTVSVTPSRLYYIPWVVPRPFAITQIGIGVTTAASGTASIGIYASGIVGNDHGPTSLLASVTGIDTSITGFRMASFNYILQAGITYWFCLICSGNPTIRALVISGTGSAVAASLGRFTTDYTHCTHLFASGSGANLPDPSPTSLSNGSGNLPAILLVE